jgi:hypothetical protein
MKLIDWTKVPRGTMTSEGELIGTYGKKQAFILNGLSTKWVRTDSLRIVPQTRWTYHDGGERPVPEGLTFEFLLVKGELLTWSSVHAQIDNEVLTSDVIAYRVVGVDRDGGWTDCPEEVTE